MLLSSLGFGHKPRGEGRPRSLHLSVLPTNGEGKEGRAPFPLISPQMERCRKAAVLPLFSSGEKKPRSFHPSAPFTPRFWPQTER